VIFRELEGYTTLSWSFIPNWSGMLYWHIPLSEGVTIHWWILSYAIVALFQCPLTLGLHCSELITNVLRDERQWRRATGKNGLKMMANPLKSFFTDPLALVLFVMKPALRESFFLVPNRFL
jgi:hypothetical protein